MSKTYHAEELTFKQLLSKYNDLAVPLFSVPILGVLMRSICSSKTSFQLRLLT